MWQLAVHQSVPDWPGPIGHVIRELISWIISTHLGLCSRGARGNLGKAVHHRFRRPIIRPVNSINRIRNEHPLVAESVLVVGIQLRQNLILTPGTPLFVKLKGGPATCTRII